MRGDSGRRTVEYYGHTYRIEPAVEGIFVVLDADSGTEMGSFTFKRIPGGHEVDQVPTRPMPRASRSRFGYREYGALIEAWIETAGERPL